MAQGISRKAALTLSAAAIGLFALAGTAQAQEQLKFAHVYEATEPFHECALDAAEQIKMRTDGRYTMEVFPASSLGKEDDLNDGLVLGTVDVIYTGNLFAGQSYGPIAIAGAPYMFRDYQHWQEYTDSDLFKELAEGYSEATGGNEVLAMTYYGERHVTSNKRIEKPEDMRNLKIRVPNAPLYQMFPKAVGANPTPIAFAEVYLALQQGTVDAQENPFPAIFAKKFYEVQQYINTTGHITDSLLTIASNVLWSRLSDEDKKIFSEVFEKAATDCNQMVRQKEDELKKWFQEQEGTEVVEVDRTPFRETTVKLHMGPDATWSQDVYDRLQSIGQQASR